MLTDRHHSIAAIPEVSQICQPLFDCSDIEHYVYARIFDNGNCYSLVTHAQQQLHHFKNEYKVTPPIPHEILRKSFYYFITENDGPFQPVLYDFRNLFNLWSPFFMINRFKGYYDLAIFFSTPKNTQVLNFYLNNIDYLENFNTYFKVQASSLISAAEKNMLLLPESMRPNFGGMTYDEKNNQLTFSKREAECLDFLSYGLTMKEMARELDLSPRTVEDYINKLKIKLNVARKSEIILAFKKLKSNFFTLP